MTPRHFNDPVYANWRKQVKERDGYCCQWPGCGRTQHLHAHHIKKWSTHPGLRFVVSNGITLCSRCHNMIKNKEEYYEEFFRRILDGQLLNKIKNFRGRRK